MPLEHRIKSTVNTSTISVGGGDVVITNTGISIGNSTVNTVITAGSVTVNGSSIGSGGGGDLSAVNQNIVPSANVTYDLGTTTMRWRDLYLSGSTIDVGGALIQTDSTSGSIAFIPKPTEENPNPVAAVVSPTGGIVSVQSDGGVITANATANAVSEANGSLVASSIKSDIFFFNNTTVTSNTSVAANTNAMSAGPITIANGVTVTVGANSEWTIV